MIHVQVSIVETNASRTQTTQVPPGTVLKSVDIDFQVRSYLLPHNIIYMKYGVIHAVIIHL